MQDLRIKNVKVVTDLCLLVTFSNDELRIFDATYLLDYPVYKELADFTVFKNIVIQNGVITWKNGKIDVDSQTVYDHSYEYEIENIVSAS